MVGLLGAESTWQAALAVGAVFVCGFVLIKKLARNLEGGRKNLEEETKQEGQALRWASVVLLLSGIVLALFPQLLFNFMPGLIERF